MYLSVDTTETGVYQKQQKYNAIKERDTLKKAYNASFIFKTTTFADANNSKPVELKLYIIMKITTNILPKNNLPQAKPAPKVQQNATVLTEDEYYNLEALLAEEKSSYYHLRYSY